MPSDDVMTEGESSARCLRSSGNFFISRTRIGDFREYSLLARDFAKIHARGLRTHRLTAERQPRLPKTPTALSWCRVTADVSRTVASYSRKAALVPAPASTSMAAMKCKAGPPPGARTRRHAAPIGESRRNSSSIAEMQPRTQLITSAAADRVEEPQFPCDSVRE